MKEVIFKEFTEEVSDAFCKVLHRGKHKMPDYIVDLKTETLPHASTTFKRVKHQYLALFMIFLFTSCSDIIEGGLHVTYGITTILFTILKWGLIIIVILFILALIVGLFNR